MSEVSGKLYIHPGRLPSHPEKDELSKKLMGRSSHFRKNVLSQRRKMLTGTSHKLKNNLRRQSRSRRILFLAIESLAPSCTPGVEAKET